ncbi:MAG: NAD(P)-dependent glycerol-3-phosphate dehydrogenase [Leptospiraceae bacterium]|nr:NAD(P)-dependent glycerol-3-phosphate dehydrogenase [Leptospiraceae bacterium]
MLEVKQIGVIGAGSYGNALALHVARKGFPTKIWAYEKEVVEDINTNHENSIFLKGYKLPENLTATNNIEECMNFGQAILSVMPTPHVARMMSQITPFIREGQSIVSCSKGIENESLEIPSEIMERVLPEKFHHQLAYLSGPSFAKEVAGGLPTAVTIASANLKLAAHVQQFMSNKHFRCYTTSDVTGVELCGALKNVIAIAAGIADGLGFGYNTRAALITRGLGEINRIAVEKKANPLTMLGLAGMGDLVLTCTGDLSRNRTVGFKIGQGEKLKDILDHMRMVAEGVLTSKSAYLLSKKLEVEVPIMEQVYRILYEDQDPKRTVENLMSRELKGE